MSSNSVPAEFSAHYLQRLTQELSEDLDRVRGADDFKSDSVPFLVHALQQGSTQFSLATQKQVVQTVRSPGEA